MRLFMQAFSGGLVVLALSGLGRAANLIDDGDFSDEPGMPPWYTSSSLSTASAHSNNGSPDGWNAYVPVGFDLGQTTSYDIVAGESYSVSYLAACVGVSAKTEVSLMYLNDGMMPAFITGASQSLSLASADGWKSYDFEFKAKTGEDYIGEKLLILLACPNTSSGSAGFDTVSIKAIPEPSAAAILLTGLLCLLACVRHKCRG
jgi:hypothetical protein